MMTRKPVRFFLSLAAVTAAALIGSMVTLPSISNWYAGLDKPFFNPPNWVFGPVWTLLYLLMGISLYLVWSARTDRSKRLALAVFGLQLVLNTTWSIVFFGLHLPWVGVGVILALWLTIAVTMGAFWPIKRTATYLLVPYLVWVSFASALNISIAIMNPPSKVDSYETCVKAQGSVILDSYPVICMTHDKQQFVNPDAHVTPPQQSTLSIPELSVIIPLKGDIADAYYSYDKETEEVYLTTTKLEEGLKMLEGCTSGLHGLYVKIEDGELKEQSKIETLCLPATNETTRQIRSLQQHLRIAIQSAKIE